MGWGWGIGRGEQSFIYVQFREGDGPTGWREDGDECPKEMMTIWTISLELNIPSELSEVAIN